MLVSFCTRQYTEKETNMADLEMVTKEWRNMKTLYCIDYVSENIVHYRIFYLWLGLKKIKVCLPFWPENWEGR